MKDLGSYSSLVEATIACSKLHAKGINAQIKDEEAHRNGLIAGQPVRLIVAEVDYLAAESVLQPPVHSERPRLRTLAAVTLVFGVVTPLAYAALTAFLVRTQGADLRLVQSVFLGSLAAAVAAWYSRRR